MIQELHISNLAVIEDTTLEFPSSYVSLVGETGAGKSLVVSSLGLLKGEKADYSLVRDDKKKAVVIGVFSLSARFLSNHPEMKEFLDEENEIILKRTLNPDRTSKTYINDEPVSLNRFKEISSHLIDIHSQGENWELYDERKHLIYLDRFAGKSIEKEKSEFQKAYQDYLEAKNERKEMEEENQNRDEEYLRFQIKEIEKADLKENEIEKLNEEYLSLRNAEKIQDLFNSYKESVLLPEGNLSEILYRTKNKLNGFESTPLEEQARKLSEEIQNLNTLFLDFEEAFHGLDIDPKRMDYINQRLYELKGLQRKFGFTTEEILEKLSDFKKQLEKAENFKEDLEEMNRQIQKKYEIAMEKAKILSEKRKTSAVRLQQAISKEMMDLGLLKDGFRVSFRTKGLSTDGVDDVFFEVRMNQGLDFTSLKKAASGGEASRLMLSLKVVLNSLDPYDLLVFDEIDTGVSGKTASLIARKIKKVSAETQVLVISHLAQVIASSNQAVRIKKTTTNGVTSTKAEVLDEKGFETEVARILSGSKITDAALDQAKELIRESR
mgnify:CR=1 FL=1